MAAGSTRARDRWRALVFTVTIDSSVRHRLLKQPWLELFIILCTTIGCKPSELGTRAGNIRCGHGYWIGCCPRSMDNSRLHRHQQRLGSALATNVERRKLLYIVHRGGAQEGLEW